MPGPDFDTFVLEHGAQLVAFARRMTLDHHRAEDAVQDALARCSRSWRRISVLANPKAYVYRAVVNAVHSQHRRRYAHEHPLDVRIVDRPDPAPTFETTVAARDELRRALLRLSARQRAVLVLRHYLEYSDADIAETLAIPVNTVRSHANRGLRRLRHRLELDRRTAEDG